MGEVVLISRGENVAALLNRYMARSGLTHADAARRVGKSRNAVWMLMRGYQGTMGLKSYNGEKPLAFAVADVLGIPRRELGKAITRDAKYFGHADLWALRAFLRKDLDGSLRENLERLRAEVGEMLDAWARQLPPFFNARSSGLDVRRAA